MGACHSRHAHTSHTPIINADTGNTNAAAVPVLANPLVGLNDDDVSRVDDSQIVLTMVAPEHSKTVVATETELEAAQLPRERASTVCTRSDTPMTPPVLASFTHSITPASSVAVNDKGKPPPSSMSALSIEAIHVRVPLTLDTVLHSGAITSVVPLTEFETVSCSNDRTIVRYNWHQQKILQCDIGHSMPIECMVIAPSTQMIYTGSRDSTIRKFAMHNPITHTAANPSSPRDSSGSELSSFRGHTLSVSALLVNHDETLLLSGSRDYSVRLWDLTIASQHSYAIKSNNIVTCMSWIRGEPLALQGNEAGEIHCWDSRDLSASNVTSIVPLANSDDSNDIVLSLDCSADSYHFLTSHRSGRLKLYDRRMMKLLSVMTGHSSTDTGTGAMMQAKFLPSLLPQREVIVSASGYDKSLRVWDINANQCIAAVTLYSNSGSDALLSCQFRSVSVGSIDIDSQSNKQVSVYTSSEDGHIVEWRVHERGNIKAVRQTKPHSLMLARSVSGGQLLERQRSGPSLSLGLTRQTSSSMSRFF